MFNYKKIYFFALISISILLTLIFWDKIKFAYDESNTIHGVAYDTKTNPHTNTLRFIFFSFVPILIFFFLYINLFNTLSLNIYNKNFFLKKYKKKNINLNLGFLTFFLIGCAVIEFLFLDYNNLLGNLDIFHEATTLVPLINYINNKTFWLSNFYEYGFWGNNLGLLSYNIFGVQSIGLIRLFEVSHILFVKIFLILICNKITFLTELTQKKAIFFFSFLALIAINLTEYFVIPPISGRALLFLIFFFLILINFEKKFFFFKNILIGFFSLISLLWFIDIGFYINGILIIYLFLLLFLQEINKIIIIFFGIILSWLFFLFFFGKDEFLEFFEQIFILFKTVEYLIFLEFPKPFTDHKDSFRGLRSLVVIIINGIFCIIFCLNKKNKINIELKICIIVFFLSSIFFFKTALTRSDSYHIRYGSGISFFLFFLNLFIFIFLKKNFFYFFIKKIILNNSKVFYFIFYFICLILFLPNTAKNFYHNNSLIFNLSKLILKDDNFFLKYEDIIFLNYYQSLTKEDKCIQVFTDYTSLPYFMKKPSCTKFFRPETILKNFTEKKFLQEFKSKSPQFILYSSPISLMTLKNNMSETNKYIKNNYDFYISFNQKWIIYIKK